MAAFWGFLFALLCVACLFAGTIGGWYLRENYDKDKKETGRRVDYSAYYTPKPSHGRYKWEDSPKGVTKVSQRVYLELLRTIRDKDVRVYTYDQQKKSFLESEAYDAFRDSNIYLVDFPEVKDDVQYFYDASKDFLFSVVFINKPREGRPVVNFGTPKLISEDNFCTEANGSNYSDLIYDPITESFIRDNGAYMYCQELIREDLVKRLKEDGVAYIYWSGDNTYSEVTMKEDDGNGVTTDNETAGA